jgi:hypothetical protein
MPLIPQLLATAGWTSFSGVFSTVFPLAVVLVIIACYLGATRKHP